MRLFKAVQRLCISSINVINVNPDPLASPTYLLLPGQTQSHDRASQQNLRRKVQRFYDGSEVRPRPPQKHRTHGA